MKANSWLLAVAMAGALAAGTGPARAETVSGTSEAVAVWTPDETYGSVMLEYPPFQIGDGDEAGWWLDGKMLFSSLGDAAFIWQAQTLGAHAVECRVNGAAVTSKTVYVSALAFVVPEGPNPPTAEDPNLSITPVTRSFGTGGGGAAIAVSGSGTWTASASVPWITLKASSGQAGLPLAYTVSATTEVEGRTGYVYVSGHVHTVAQEGTGGTIAPESATCESAGGMGTIRVAAPDQQGWQARANAEWLSVVPTSGTGAGSVTYMVAPLNEVTTRQGTLTVAGNTFTVFQYGRRIKLSPTAAECDYLTHVIPITVDALASTTWTVEPQNSWISVVDGGNGYGGDLVTVAIAENPSWKGRTGTVKIGTETFTVTQAGRTALEFGIHPARTTASVNGANGVIAVTATPDLPWSAASQANWLTVYEATVNGAGNGNVVYSASPNPTLYERTGTVTVTPRDAKVPAQTHTATQPAAASALSMNAYEFEAAGENCEVRVSVPDIVQWQIENPNGWLKVLGGTDRMGPATVTLQAVPNGTVEARSGTVTIARKPFRVAQRGRAVEVEYESKVFGTDGGDGTILVHPDGDVGWTAVASDPSMIVIFSGESGLGDGEIYYIVAPYQGTGGVRTETIKVGDKVVYITQRAYDLSIAPNGVEVAGNNGAGEFGVSAPLDAVWTAIATEPWITIIEGYDAGTGSGTVRFAYTENDTGRTRTGKIIVAGEAYTLEQQAWQFVTVTAEAGRGGTVSGSGRYDVGAEVTLRAEAGDGYAFVRWTGDVSSTANPLRLTADASKLVTAEFEALPVAFTGVVSGTEGVSLSWNNLAWAMSYRVLRGATGEEASAEVLAEIPNTGACEWRDATGELGTTYWYWVEAVGALDYSKSEAATGRKTWEWPDAGDADEVAAVLGGAADARLAERLATVADYEAFRGWVAEKGLDGWAVMGSEHAWPSYALGAERLFEEEPVITVDGIAVVRSGAEGTSMEVRVTVEDGGGTVAVDASRIAGMFQATGDLRDWAGEASLAAAATPTGGDGGAMLFQVVAGEGTEDGAFLRLALKTPQRVSFRAIGEQMATNRVTLSATATSGGAVTFEVVEGPGVVLGDVLTFTGGGTVVVRANQAGNDRWGAASATQTVAVRAEQTIDFSPIGGQVATNRVTLSATATSGGAVTFEVVEGPGVVAGNVLTFTGGGTVMVKAVQAGDERWVASSATQAVSVAKASQTMDFAPIGMHPAAGRAELSATATSGLPVTFEIVSGPGSVEGNLLTLTGMGWVVVRAVQAGDDRWREVSAMQWLEVGKQMIEFEPIGVQTPEDRVELSTKATSGGAVTFELLSGPGVLEGNVLTFSGEGVVEIQAKQAGDGQWQSVAARELVTVTERGAFQLWEGGPYWSVRNVGAEEPWDTGLYFWWGDTAGCRREGDAWVSSDGKRRDFSFSEKNAPTCNKSNDTLQGEGWITPEGALAPDHDAAQVFWGETWRMPTEEEQINLLNNCDWEWMAWNGVNGCFIRGRGDYAKNGIFLPAAGYGKGTSLICAGSIGDVWSSVPYSYETDCGDAYHLNLVQDRCVRTAALRSWGCSIRPVKVEQAMDFAAVGPQRTTNRVDLTATATSGLPVTFTVVSGPGEIAGNVLTFTGEGTVVVRAEQAGDGQWLPVTAMQTVEVIAKWGGDTQEKYLVVDLSGGPNAASWPVEYMEGVPAGGFNTDEYKTTKLVLRWIDPGAFMMNGNVQTTLSKPFYIGLFEVTQKQYELVTGSNPSSFSGDKRPVEYVSWNTIRGDGGWPGSSAVSADSFMGRLRARTGLGEFDLPTEAQWEYACRAGTTTAYSYGESANGDYMWYTSNSSRQTHEVGTKKPNPWGLYDMHGNVSEWCLDWYGSLSGGTDPKGSSSGSNRVRRGGGWNYFASYCASSNRSSSNPSDAGNYYDHGFRLVRTLSK